MRNTFRYVDEQNSPQFPFGYGLSYADYHYGNLRVDKTRLSAKALNDELHGGERAAGRAMIVNAEITNTGTRAGEENGSALRAVARNKRRATGSGTERVPADHDCSRRNEKSDVRARS